jgi:hypothetical protein
MMRVPSAIDLTSDELAELGEATVTRIRGRLEVITPALEKTPELLRRHFNACARGALGHAIEGRNVSGGGSTNWPRERWLAAALKEAG